MELQELTKNGVTIVELRGRLDEIAAAKAERRFRELLAEGARRVVVDMSEVDYVNSNGLRALLVLHQGLEQPGAGMCLCGVTSFVAEIIAISKLDEYLQIQPDRVSALAAFGVRAGTSSN